jgi:hypothetical protein
LHSGLLHYGANRRGSIIATAGSARISMRAREYTLEAVSTSRPSHCGLFPSLWQEIRSIIYRASGVSYRRGIDADHAILRAM